MGAQRRRLAPAGGIRLWISPSVTMYLIEELLTTTDSNVRALVDELEFVIAPVINPDGEPCESRTHTLPNQRA